MPVLDQLTANPPILFSNAMTNTNGDPGLSACFQRQASSDTECRSPRPGI